LLEAHVLESFSLDSWISETKRTAQVTAQVVMMDLQKKQKKEKKSKSANKELVFFSVLYIKLFELGVEVTFNNRSAATHRSVKPNKQTNTQTNKSTQIPTSEQQL